MPFFLFGIFACDPTEKLVLDEGVRDFLVDADGDGFYSDEDCDDDNSIINPSAPEVCDGADNNCDGNVDEDVGQSWYLDADGDGFGDSEQVMVACSPPSGYIGTGNDCDDSDNAIWPGNPEVCDDLDNDCDGTIDEDLMQTFYLDADQDGFGNPDVHVTACEAPSGYIENSDDCDDGNPNNHPEATEICDEIDNDCDGLIDSQDSSFDASTAFEIFQDSDGDSYGDPYTASISCNVPSGYVTESGDCDDNDQNIFPAAIEACDGIDNDCNSLIDDADYSLDLTSASYWYQDSDADGYGNASTSQRTCIQPNGYVSDDTDCDDSEASAFPGNPEICDSVDNDCNGATDDGLLFPWYLDNDGDGFGDTNYSQIACSQISGYVTNNSDCDDSENTAFPGNPEICDAIDNDCNGATDDGLTFVGYYLDNDGDGYGDTSFEVNSCEQPNGHVPNDFDCDDNNALIQPTALEVCDSIDNDCDGLTDDSDPSLDTTTQSTWYADNDNDGFGSLQQSILSCFQPLGYSASGTDCDDGEITAFPGNPEVCDGIDNDCNGSTDEGLSTFGWFADFDGDGFGDPLNTILSCLQPSGFIVDNTDCDDNDPDSFPNGTEVCDNADNDCNGVIDDSTAIDALPWYWDGDGDQYGNGPVVYSCTQPPSHSSINGDCNDSLNVAYPNAPELCDSIDNDCDGVIDNGVLGSSASCPAQDCAEILATNPNAGNGSYYLAPGVYACEMTTAGGGWTRIAEAAPVWGTGYSSSSYNGESFIWSDMLFRHHSGSVHAHCTYPESLTGCNNIGFKFTNESWGVAQNWGSSLCSLSVTSAYTGSTQYIGGWDFIISRPTSTSTVQIGTLEGIAGCTTADNPGQAYIDLWVR